MKKLIYICLAAFILQSCAYFKVLESDYKPAQSNKIELSNNLSITNTGVVKIFKNDFLPSSYLIKYEGKIIYVDPVKVEDMPKADYIFITHAHMDHCSPNDINLLYKEGTKIIGPKQVVKKIKKYSVQLIKPDDIVNFANFTCEAIPSYNLKRHFLSIVGHPKNAMNVGYVLTIDDERIFISGDTDFISEMTEIKDISIALVPIDGGNLTMETGEAADLINILKPKIAVPVHYRLGYNNAKEFKNLVNENINVIIWE